MGEWVKSRHRDAGSGGVGAWARGRVGVMNIITRAFLLNTEYRILDT